jgi:hypothetical protein
VCERRADNPGRLGPVQQYRKTQENPPEKFKLLYTEKHIMGCWYQNKKLVAPTSFCQPIFVCPVHQLVCRIVLRVLVTLPNVRKALCTLHPCSQPSCSVLLCVEVLYVHIPFFCSQVCRIKPLALSPSTHTINYTNAHPMRNSNVRLFEIKGYRYRATELLSGVWRGSPRVVVAGTLRLAGHCARRW